MERGDGPQESPVSNEALNKILRNWSAANDLPEKEYADETYVWAWPNGIPYRPIKRTKALEAQAYINYIIKQYPVQLRPRFGKELWVEFCEYWSVNPDFNKAIRYL